jgi:hypothetical protein
MLRGSASYNRKSFKEINTLSSLNLSLIHQAGVDSQGCQQKKKNNKLMGK